MGKHIVRVISVLCAANLLLATLYGCGSREAAAGAETAGKQAAGSAAGAKEFENKELDVAVFQGAYGREFWDALAEKFQEAYPGTRIHITANPRIGEMIRPKMVAGNIPDFIYLDAGEQSGVVTSLIKDRELTDLTGLFNERALDRERLIRDAILPGILDSNICSPYNDGKIYLAPYNYCVMGLWYNKDLFERKQIAPPKTWDDFFALKDTAAREGRALFTYQGIYPSYNEEIMIPALYSAGGGETVEKYFNYSEGLWKSEPAKKVLGIFGKIAEGDLLMSGTVALNHTQAQTEFLKGKAMFIPNGSWFEGEMKDAPREEGFRFGFLGIPAFRAGDPVTCMVNIETLMIPAKAKNPELAKEFLKYVYTEESVRLNGEKARAVMAVEGAVELVRDSITPSSYECFKAVENGMMPVMGAFGRLAKSSTVNAANEIYKPLTAVMNRQLTTDQWAEELDRLYLRVRTELAAEGG
jgi:N-acetylglucosamine transport system substrate-binding protein